MTFEVQYAQREPLKTFEIARELVARAPGKRPDYIVLTDDYSVADQLLKIIDPTGVKPFSLTAKADPRSPRKAGRHGPFGRVRFPLGRPGKRWGSRWRVFRTQPYAGWVPVGLPRRLQFPVHCRLASSRTVVANNPGR
jgi:hypothetical protein